MIVECKKCGKVFNKIPSAVRKSPNHYCSRSCAAAVNNRVPKRKRSPRACLDCGREYRYGEEGRRSVFCLGCRDEPRPQARLTLGSYRSRLSVKGKHPSWRHSHIRAFARSWNRDIAGLPCQVCGYALHTELCHIRPVASFSSNALLGTVNAPSNLLVLCRNHHWELDHGILPLESIPPRPKPVGKKRGFTRDDQKPPSI